MRSTRNKITEILWQVVHKKRDNKIGKQSNIANLVINFHEKTFIPQTGKSKEAEESLTLKWLAMCIMLDYTNATVRFLWAFTYYLEYFNNAIKQVWPIMIWLFIHFIISPPGESLPQWEQGKDQECKDDWTDEGGLQKKSGVGIRAIFMCEKKTQ